MDEVKKTMSDIDRPILITGCARSGTSMTAGIIALSGAWGGQVAGPTNQNRKGMFENSKIRRTIVKPFLKSLGCDPMGQDPLPDIDAVKLVTWKTVYNWRKRIKGVILHQGYEGGIWYYKGAKMANHWPIWSRAFPYARWIVVRRKSDEIVKSCLKTSFMRAFKTSEGWFRWVDYHKDRFLEMEEAGMDIQYVWPQKMIDFDLSEIKGVVQQLGLRWDREKIEKFIEPALWSGGQSNGK